MFRIIKLTTLLLLGICLHISAKTSAQHITISGKNLTLQKVFNQIHNQTGYDFFYEDELLDKAARIDIHVTNASLQEVLTICFKGLGLRYQILHKTIIITKGEPKESRVVTDMALISDIKGKVVNEKGEPVSATITEKGKKNATATNDKGEFELKGVSENATLVITGVNIVTDELKLTKAQEFLLITVKTKTSVLSETVVIGYGTARRKDLTGSVASINVNEVKDVPFATIDQAMVGKAAGVQVTQADGSPGGVAKIRIRGGTSLIGGNDPLYIIDGIPVSIENRYLQSAAEIVSPVERYGSDNPNNTVSGSFARGLNSLGGLNIGDIESIDILKDASATAIYGSKAANGVIIITTKKGKLNQKPTLQANYYVGVSSPIKEKLLNADQYIAIMKEGAKNLNEARLAIGLPPDPTAVQVLTNPAYLGTASTDWLKLVLRNGLTQNADIAVRGGGAASRYYTSLSYTGHNGTVIGTDFKRISGKINLDNEISDRLRIISNLDYGFTKNKITNGIYTQALYMPPTIPAYNPDGSIYVVDPSTIGAYDYQGYQNPLLMLNGVNESNSITLLGSLSGEYDFSRFLKFKSLLSVNYNNYHQVNYVPSTARIASDFGTSTTPGIASQSQSRDVSIFFENTLTYDKQINKSNRINILAGTSWQKSRANFFSASGQGFPDDKYLNNLSSAAIPLPPSGGSGQNSLLSFYLRANYALKEKYLVTFTGRSDISSKFPAARRVGYFPSAGLAWRISEEKFLNNVRWLNELKLRVSAGYTGTQNIGDNLFYTLYSPVSYVGNNGLTPSQLGNENLKWESTLQKDAGIDVGLFDSRLLITFGVYEKKTSGALYTTTVAPSSGYSNYISNIADIQNRGFEFDVRFNVIKNKNFQWTSSLNLSSNQSKVLNISNDVGAQAGGIVQFGNTALQVGQPLGLLYGRKFEGIIRNQKELDEYRGANVFAQYGLLPYLDIGDAKYLLDKDGFFKDTIIGRAEPKLFGGITNIFTYKNFSLTTLLTFSYGGSLYYVADGQNHELANRTNKGVAILDHWSVDNPNSNSPRLLLGESSFAYLGSNNVYKTTFIKLKSVTLNYELNSRLLSKLRIKSSSIYLSATNLFVITKYPGPDPEVSNDPYSIIGGYSDIAAYPTARQYSAGVRIGF